MAMLMQGLSGEPVKVLQRKLGISDDGQFGPGTKKALEDYQKQHGLQVDGIAGPDTFAEMGLYELVLLTEGTSGTTVKALQQALGIEADGRFGPGTRKAVTEFQQKNGLDSDGMAGPDTLAKLQLFKDKLTAAVVARSQVGGGGAAAAPTGGETAVPAPKRSIWGTIKKLLS